MSAATDALQEVEGMSEEAKRLWEKKYNFPPGTLDGSLYQKTRFKDWKDLFEKFYQGAGEAEAMQRGTQKEG